MLKKDLGILARSGFDFDTSKRVLDIEKEEYFENQKCQLDTEVNQQNYL